MKLVGVRGFEPPTTWPPASFDHFSPLFTSLHFASKPLDFTKKKTYFYSHAFSLFFTPINDVFVSHFVSRFSIK
ncbi:MAG: hypothetical protein L6271_11835, partial [Desulfobacteraceae bacterium]|nr:hypothetical protein [Pseudomonadota bacterium]MCG2744590.1 hypothetical protein [Desulfobacteraceae bacterium]